MTRRTRIGLCATMALLLCLAFAGGAQANTFTISGSMEGAIVVQNGDYVQAGYSFSVGGGHPDMHVLMANAKVTITGACSNGGTDTLTIPLRAGDKTFNQPYFIAAGDGNWQPSSDQSSPDSYQSPIGFQANVCGGVGTLNASKGATISADLQADYLLSNVAVRFHYRDPNAKGKGNWDCSAIQGDAATCGASWSATLSLKPDAIPHPKMNLVKTQALPGQPYTHADLTGAVGTKITYKIVVTNTGDVDLTTNTLDPPAGKTGCDNGGALRDTPAPGPAITQPVTIPVGQSKTYYCDHTLTNADATSGTFTNFACTSGTAPDGTPAQADTQLCDNVTVKVPKLNLVKTQALPGKPFTHNDLTAAVGTKITYQILVTNTGPVELDTTTTDPGLAAGNTGCDNGGALRDTAAPGPTVTGKLILASGASKTYYCDHTITNADATNGSFTNYACTEGVTTDGNNTPAKPDTQLCDNVTVKVPRLNIVKTQALPGQPFTHADLTAAVGTKITYQLTVTNTGPVELNTTTTDPGLAAGNTGCDNGGALRDTAAAGPTVSGKIVLAPGASKTYYCDHTITNADATNGSFTNYACTEGTTTDGNNTPAGPGTKLCDNVIVKIPKLNLVKTQALPGKPFTHADLTAAVGTKITYQILVTNTGPVELNTTTTDPGLAAGNTGCDNGGALRDTAAAGPTVSGKLVLAAGASKTYYCDHTITNADVANGSFTNYACTEGVTTDGNNTPAKPDTQLCDNVTVKIPKLNLVKRQALPGGAFTHNDLTAAVGTKITYEIKITNTGPVELNTTTTDPGLAAGNTGCDNGGALRDTAAAGPTVSGKLVLAAGASKLYYCDHTLTAADAANAQFTNYACTEGVTTDGNNTPAAPDTQLCDHVTVRFPSLNIVKKQALPGGSFTHSDLTAAVGTKITYQLTVTNTGPVELNTTTTDPGLAAGNTGCDNGGALRDTAAPGPTVTGKLILASGASKTYYCDHTITNADATNGSFTNYACTEGTTTDGNNTPAAPNTQLCDHVIVKIPKLNLVKKQALPGGSFTHNDLTAAVGTKITYQVIITNTGPVELSTKTTDPGLKAGTTGCDNDLRDSAAPGPATAQPLVLAAGASHTYYCDHTITNADATNGSFTNYACTEGVTTDGNNTPAKADTQLCDNVTVKVPKMNLVKTQALPGGSFTHNDLTAAVGTKITYQVVITNTGPVELSTTTTDPGLKAGSTGCDNALRDTAAAGAATAQPLVLAAGASHTYYCDHTLTNADASNGFFTNYACTEGVTTDGNNTPAAADTKLCDNVTVRIPGGISGHKFEDANANGVRDSGEQTLAGFTIYIDSNNNGSRDSGEPFKVTDSNGFYSFTGLTPGNYVLREDLTGQSNWTCSAPVAAGGVAACSYVVSLGNDSVTDRDFGNWQPGQISGFKYQDTNGNGTQDTGETALAGFTFYVDYNNNSALDSGEPSAQSGADGKWTITGVKPGSFNVREVVSTGYTCTQPAAGCSYPVTVTSNSQTNGLVFGNNPGQSAFLPERVTPGKATLSGPTGCVSKPFSARVRGTKVQTVVFKLDGKVVKRFTKPVSSGNYAFRIDPKKMRIGVHRMVVSVTFQKGTGTKPKTMRLSFQRCAKKLSAPRFTG